MTVDPLPPREFQVLTLNSADVTLRCAPELGGRVFSVVNRRSQREWLWRRESGPQLFLPGDPRDFGTGCFAGLDECVPSVGACVWSDGRTIADHGALWVGAWKIENERENGFTLSAESAELGLRFTRRIELAGPTIRFEYALANVSSVAAPAMWCMHPLFTIEPGDRLELPPSVRTLRVQGVRPALDPGDKPGTNAREADTRPDIAYPEMSDGVRLDQLSLADNAGGFLKAFTGRWAEPVGRAALRNERTGDGLEVTWDAVTAPYLGLWLTRGGYRGWHHVALEPTTAPHDHVDVAARDPALTTAVTLAAGTRRAWWVEWRVT